MAIILFLYYNKNTMQLELSVKDLSIDRTCIYNTLGYGDATPDEYINSIIEEWIHKAEREVKTQFYYKKFNCSILNNQVIVNHIGFHTEFIISKLIRNSEEVAVFVATAGPIFQEWMNKASREKDVMNLFLLDAIGTVLVETTGDYMENILQKDIADLKHTNRFSPGYCNWDIKEQHKLFSLLPKGICNISLSNTCLMQPEKSISGIIGIGENVITKKYGCSICKQKNCKTRKKP